MQGAKFEALVLTLYAIAMIGCAVAIDALTAWPHWLAFIAGGVAGLLVAIMANALVVFALGFRAPPGE